MNAFRPRRPVLITCLAVVVSMIGATAGVAANPLADVDVEPRKQFEHVGIAYHLIDAVFNGRNLAAAPTLVAEDAEIATPNGTFSGPDGLLAYAANIRAVYRDASFTITSLSATNDAVVVGWKMTATQFAWDTSGRVDIFPMELTGKFTISVDDGQVTRISAVSRDLIVEGPADLPGT